MKETESKIEVFLDSVPWIKNFKNKVFVLKYGGELLQTDENMENIAEDVDLLSTLGIHTVIVHGGGPQLDDALKKNDINFDKKKGMRVYSPEILSTSQKVFRDIGANLQKTMRVRNINARSIPNDYIRVKRISNLGSVGKVSSINPLFSKMTTGLFVPIMPLFGFDEEGNLCNVNADDMAVSVAEMLRAEKLIIHSTVDGVQDGQGKRITHLDLEKAKQMIKNGHIKGGMIPKVIHCLKSKKVDKIHIINGYLPHALLYEVFTDEGIGTEIVKDKF